MSNEQRIESVPVSTIQNSNVNEVNCVNNKTHSIENNKTTKFYKRHIIAVYAISGGALLLSIYLICRNYSSSWDYVGILSLLVTALVGMNIYTIIDAKQFKKETNDILKEQANEVGAMIYQMHAQSLFYNMHNPREAIAQIMRAIEMSSKLKNKDALASNISCLVRICGDLNGAMAHFRYAVKFNADTIEKYCQILTDTNNLQAMDMTSFIRSCQEIKKF